MTRARLCRVCRVEAQGAQLPVLMRVHVVEQWHLCGRCWALLQIGVPLMRPESRLEHFVDRGGLLLSASWTFGRPDKEKDPIDLSADSAP